jgi:hypothetical protein
MADQLRVVRATGADGPVLLTGIFAGISKRPTDQYNKGKQPVYVPESSTIPALGAAGLTTALVDGFIDLDPTMDVQRMLNEDDGSINLLTAAGDVSNSGVYDDAAVGEGVVAGASLLAGPNRVNVVGSLFTSLSPVTTQLHVRDAAQLVGVTGGATKNTSAAGANVLTVAVNGGLSHNFLVTQSATLANGVLLRELMQGFAAAGFSTDELFADLSDAAASVGTLTLTANVQDGDEVEIDGKTYTFQVALTDVDGNVLVGASASDSIDNLIAAINLGAGAGTLYAASTTLHPSVFVAPGAGDTMDATAKEAGVAGDAISTTDPTDTGGAMAWGAATLGGGADGTTVRISSPLGSSLEVVASGLATVLGITPGTDTPAVRGTVAEGDFDTFEDGLIEVLDTNGEYPVGTASGDYAVVMANGQLTVRTVIYDSVSFDAPFAIVA